MFREGAVEGTLRMERSQRQEEPPGRGDSRTKDLLADKLSLRGRNKVEVGWSPQVKKGPKGPGEGW